MEKEKIRTIYVSTLKELFIAIKTTLILCKNIQFFISSALFNRLLQENESNLLWAESVLDSLEHYNQIETAFIFSLTGNKQTTTFQIHLVKNCSDYMHITFFGSTGVIYRHDLKEIDIILIINPD